MIYVTLMYEHSKENECLKISKSALQVADNVFQVNLLDGLRGNLVPGDIHIVNSLPFGCWPNNCKKLFFKTQRTVDKNDVKIVNIGFINLPLIKSFCRYFSYVRILNRLFKKDNQGICLVYGLYLPQLLALKAVKRRNKNAHICLIVDDMPAGFGINKGSSFRRALKGNKDKKLLQCLNDKKIVDSFVFLTEQMSNVLEMGERKYCVVEGIVPSTVNVLPTILSTEEEEKIVLYAGTLNKEFGILSLINAFNMIKGKEYRLWICGTGDAKAEVIAAAEKDYRIHYYGFVSKEKANELQAKATVLVNPRKNYGEYVKYSFPSKTIEYLLAQKPVVMYKLAGIPDEYDKHLNYVEDGTDKALANTIERVCAVPFEQRSAKASLTRDWLLKNKCADTQVKKIIDMIISDSKK